MNKQELMNWIESSRTMIKKLDFTDVSDDDRADYLQSVMYKLFNEVEGLISEIDEPTKVKIPHFIAEYIKECKTHDNDMYKAVSVESWENEAVCKWLEDGNEETFALAWIVGYEVEQEPLYIVPVPYLTKEFFYMIDSRYVSFCQRKNIDGVKAKVKFTFEEVKQHFPDLVGTAQLIEPVEV